MSASVAVSQTQHVVESLDNDACPFCDGGALERGRYRGDPAVVCDSCETPLIRL